MRGPELPVTVILAVPVVAVAEAVSVSTEVAAPLAGGVTGSAENVAVTPLGRPAALSVVAELKLLWLVIVIVLVPPLPRKTVKVFGEAVSLKFPNGLTVSVMVVVALRVPDVPVIATVVVPVGAASLAVSVRTLLEVAGFGLKAAVTPFGRPDADSVTFPVNPFTGVIVIVLVPLLPCVMLTLLGAAARLKFGLPFTVRLNVVV